MIASSYVSGLPDLASLCSSFEVSVCENSFAGLLESKVFGDELVR